MLKKKIVLLLLLIPTLVSAKEVNLYLFHGDGCPHCAKEREFTEKEKEVINKIGEKYNVKFDLEGKKTYEAVGCNKCNKSGYLDRIGIFEILNVDDEIRDLISKDSSSMDIRKKAMELGYKPLVIDGINKVLSGITTLEEINNKLIIY